MAQRLIPIVRLPAPNRSCDAMNTNPNQTAGPPTHPHLPKDERRLFEYLDGQSSPHEALAVPAHLADCPECRQLRQQWRQLDSQLVNRLQRPAFSAGFVNRLLQRIETEAVPTLADPDLQQKRVQLETELHRHSLRDRKNFLRSQLPALLDYIGYAVLVGLGSYFLFGLLNHFLKTLLNAPTTPSNQLVLPISCGITAILLCVGLCFAAKHRLWRWFAEL